MTDFDGFQQHSYGENLMKPDISLQAQIKHIRSKRNNAMN